MWRLSKGENELRKRNGQELELRVAMKVLVSIEEAAILLSLGRTEMYRLVRTGEIPSVKVRRSRRVVVTALHDYVAQLLVRAS
jgi:excisionase family DNA binding protein